MKKRLMAVTIAAASAAAILIALLSGGAAGASAGSTQEAEVPPTLAQVHQAALRAAALQGELAPTSIEETTGTLGQTGHVIDPHDAGMSVTDPRTGAPWADSSVYVVTMRGHFTYNGPAPKNRPVPTGTVLTVVLDGKSGRLVAESLNNSVPDLHQINSSVTDLGAAE